MPLTENQRLEAELKLNAYKAAITACSAGKDYSMQSMGIGSCTGPTAAEIKTEADRLWGWMSEQPKPKEETKLEATQRDGYGMQVIDENFIRIMVDRFLGWSLPQTFGPDCFIAFDRVRAKANSSWPIGTNLLDATQARAMVMHMLGVK